MFWGMGRLLSSGISVYGRHDTPGVLVAILRSVCVRRKRWTGNWP